MIIAVIPARGGSKSIKNKNIVALGGKPLIAWSIEIALSCKKIDKVIVSTDSPKIAKIAEKYGAEVPFLRPKKLASDTSPGILTFKHAVRFLENKGEKINAIVELQPTSPFRRTIDIEKSIEMLKKPQTDSVAGVCKVEHSPYFVMGTMNKGYFSYPLIKAKKQIYNRQQTPAVYRLTGSLYTVKKDVLMKKNTDITSKTRVILMPQELGIDIDSLFDLQYAEFLLKNSKILVSMKAGTAKR